MSSVSVLHYTGKSSSSPLARVLVVTILLIVGLLAAPGLYSGRPHPSGRLPTTDSDDQSTTATLRVELESPRFWQRNTAGGIAYGFDGLNGGPFFDIYATQHRNDNFLRPKKKRHLDLEWKKSQVVQPGRSVGVTAWFAEKAGGSIKSSFGRYTLKCIIELSRGGVVYQREEDVSEPDLDIPNCTAAVDVES